MKLSPYQQFLLIFFIFPAGSSLFHLRPSWFRSCFRFFTYLFTCMYYSSMISPPNSSPIFGRDISVSSLHRYIAICLGNAMSLVLFFDLNSSGLMSKYLATASWIVVQFKTFALFADSMSLMLRWRVRR